MRLKSVRCGGLLMRARLLFGLGCGLLLSLPGWLTAQVPLPGAPTAAAPTTAAAGTTAATQAATTAATTAAPQKPLASALLSCLCPTPEQREARRQKFCNCALGQMLNSMLKPVTMFSGGLIPDICPPNKPNLDDLKNKAPDSAEGAAAAIQKSEAEAAARRAAVRYLGTVDCHWYPE